MLQTITAKLKIETSPEEAEMILETMRLYTKVCNDISQFVFETHMLNNFKVQKEIYHNLRNKYGLKSQMTISCIRTVVSKYKSLPKGTWTKPNFKIPQLEMIYNRDYGFDKDYSHVGISTCKGRIKVAIHREGYEQHFKNGVVFGTAKLVYKHNKFFVHVPMTHLIEELKLENVKNVIGHDRGLRFCVASFGSDGKTTFYSGKKIKQKRKHYLELRKQLQQVGTSSSRRRLKSIGQRENRWMQDVNHCISKALVENNPKGTLHVLEDLSNVGKAIGKTNKKNKKELMSWSYHDLEQKLIYKAREAGQKVIKVDPRYTSQTCPKCGHIERANRDKKNHIFCCRNCGYKSNDDRIGAMNLYRMGIEYLVELQVSTSDL